MKRAFRVRRKIAIFIVGIVVSTAISVFLLPEAASADSYYYKKTQDGTIHFTNINPKSGEYKSMETPWGALKTAPRVVKINSKGKYKYPDNFDEHINSTAVWYGVDPLLIKAMIKVESNFNPQALSPKGAMGIMQLMPETAKKNGVSDAFDPQDNIEGGIRYFNKLMIMFNNRLTLALAGYNAGENAVIKYGYKIPPYPETIDYVEKVYTHYDNLRDKKVKRNITAMVAERFDKKKPGKKKSGSFLYVETLESETFASNKPGRKAAPQKPKIILKPKTRSNVSAASANAVYGDSLTGMQIIRLQAKAAAIPCRLLHSPISASQKRWRAL